MATQINPAKLGTMTNKELIDLINANFTSLDENKVEKVAGQGLSTNDFTNTLKTKLEGIASGAQVNVIENVSVDGTALTITNKGVNITTLPIMQKLKLQMEDGNQGKIGLYYGTDKLTEVDTALELIVSSGSYDAANKRLVLTLANGTAIYIPVADLIDEYYADGTTVTLAAVDGKQTFSIATAVMEKINKSVTDITNLTGRVQALEAMTVQPVKKSFTAVGYDSTVVWVNNGDGSFTLAIPVSATAANGTTVTQRLQGLVYNSAGKSVFVEVEEDIDSNVIKIVASEKFAGYFYVL